MLINLKDNFIFHIDKPIANVESIARNTSVFIANDCGPSHFSHFYNIPHVSVFSE